MTSCKLRASRVLVPYVPDVPMFNTCLRIYVAYVPACLHVFAYYVIPLFYVPSVPLFFTCFHFFTCLMCRHFYVPYFPSFFYVPYAYLYFYVPYVPSFFTCL